MGVHPWDNSIGEGGANLGTKIDSCTPYPWFLPNSFLPWSVWLSGGYLGTICLWWSTWWPVPMRMCVRMYVCASGGLQAVMVGLVLLYSLFLIMFVWWPGLCYATRSGLKLPKLFCPRINIMLTRDEFALCLALLLLHRNKAGQSQAEPQKQEKNPGKGEKGGISFLFLCKQREEIMKGCIISFVAKIRRNKSQSKKSL